MLRNLALRNKMIIGFGSVIVLLMVVAFVSWNAINGSSEGFMQYRGLARDTNLSGRLQANMLMVRMNVKDFLITGSDLDKKQYAEYMEKMRTFLEEAKKEIQNPERAANIKKVDEAVLTYNDGFKAVTEYRVTRNKEVDGILNVKGPFMENTLTDILESAKRDNDDTASYRSSIAMKHLLLARLYMAKFLDTNDEEAVARVKEEFGKMEKSLLRLNIELQNKTRRRYLSDARKAKKEYIESFDRLVTIIKDRNEVITGTLDRLGPIIAKSVEDVKLSVKGEQDVLGPKLQAENQQAVVMIIIMAVIALIIGIIATWLLTSSITKPLKKIFQGLKAFSNGELEEVREKFDTVIKDLEDGGENIASASQQIASGAAEQAASIEETTSSLEEMSGMVKTNVDSSEKAVNIAGKVNKESQDGNEAMGKLQNSMNEILVSNEKIEELVKVIGNIGDKTQVMDEIVFQTKLLSFNASVEAERAGEHGRGFAVVAQEVGNLAQMSGKSAQEIADIVKESIKNAEVITSENKGKVEEGNNYVKESGSKLKVISSAAKDLAAGSQQVLNASQDQSKGIEQINTAMQQVDKATQENSAATEELSGQAEALKSSVGVLLEIVRGTKSGRDIRSNAYTPQETKKVIDLKKFEGSREQKIIESHGSEQEIAKAVNEDNWERL